MKTNTADFIGDKTDPVKRTSKVLIVLLMLSISTKAYAGPPFFTDDPQPVDFRHWEFYVSSAMQFANSAVDATLPHLEANYGLVTDVQIHVILPLQYTKRESASQYAYSSTEVGVKYRFIGDENSLQIGTFPIGELPTGKKQNLAGENNLKLFLPLWIQKSVGKFTTYGGGGYWHNPGDGNRDWWFTGWQAQYDLSEKLSLGGELFYHTSDTNDGTSATGFTIGGYFNADEHNHILFSIGHSISGESSVTGYFGYQLTI